MTRTQRKGRRGRSAPPGKRGRFYVPPLATDYEISLQVVRSIAAAGEISVADQLAATRMLLQKDGTVLGALGIRRSEAVFSEDVADDEDGGETNAARLADFMKSKRPLLDRMAQSLAHPPSR